MKSCATCGKSKEDKHFRKDGRYKDNLSPICNGCRGAKQHTDAQTLLRFIETVDESDRWTLFERVFASLPTVDIEGVPILTEGGPYFGTGSPPEGDFFSKADLELIAEQTNMLEAAGELKPPSKLGHSEDQRLLNNSGLPVADELPAAGWLTNFRVEKVSGQWKLLTDVKQIPAKLGQIFASGGYRSRSVELSKVTSVKANPGTQYDGVVTGLAWLGAKMPAVRTLDDVWNLYADSGPARSLATGDVVWEEEDGVMDLISDLTAAINQAIAPDEPSYMWELWVNDVNLKMNACTASDWDSDTTWIIGFKVGADNEPVVDDRAKWVPSTMKLVEIDAAAADPLGGGGMPMDGDEEYGAATYMQHRQKARAYFERKAADTKGMKLTDEQIATLAKTFAIKGDDVNELRPKVEAKLAEVNEATATETKPEPTPTAPAATQIPLASFSEEQRAELTPLLATLTERAERGDRAFAQHFAEVRDGKILRAMEEGRLNPADREHWVTFYNASPDLAAQALEKLPVNPILLLTLGDDADGLDGGGTGNAAVADAYLAATGAEGPVGAASGGDA